MREDDGIGVGDALGLNHHAHLATGLHGIGVDDTGVCVGDGLELLQALDVAFYRLATGPGARGRDRVCRLYQERHHRSGLDVRMVGLDGMDDGGRLPVATAQIRADDGMAALDASVLQAKRLVNLDSEEEGVFTVGCAGGTHLDLVLPVQMKVKTGMMLHVEIAGLRGGHSGECIDRGRANAIMLMGRLLRKLFKKSEFSLSSLEGGSKDNAIPRSCTADLLFFGQFDNRIISNTVEKFTEQIQNEYQFTDPDIEVRSGWTDMTAKEAQVATAHDTRKTVAILTALPNGLMETDPNTGRPQTSLNLGICQMKDDQVQITYLVRSSINSQKKYLCSKVKAIGELAGARIDTTGDYPAWEYQKDCPLRDTLVEVYKKAYGKEPKISITHGGLECGILAAKIPGLQSVSLGPDMEGIHTPDEKLSVESVRRTWDFLVRAMEALA